MNTQDSSSMQAASSGLSASCLSIPGVAEALLETVEALVVVLTRDGVVLECNRFFETKSGFNAEELHGRHIASAVLELKEHEPFLQFLKLVATGQTDENLNSTLVAKLQARHQIRWTGVRLVSENETDRHSRILLCGTDITAERDAQQKLAVATTATNNLQREVRELKAVSHAVTGKGVERRGEERRNYRYQQPLAPIMNGRMPREADFTEVTCRDIGARGFAFLSDNPPGYRDVVVGLGTKPSRLYLTATIKHITNYPAAEDEKYLVGCQYTGRLAGI